MQVDKSYRYTIRHRGTRTLLAEASSEDEARRKIAVHRTTPPDTKVSRMWHEPLSVTVTEIATITASGVAFEPGASSTLTREMVS